MEVMMRFLTAIALTAIALTGKATFSPGQTTTPVTFNKEVLPVLQKNCQTCHRPGQIGPMSFLTYQSTRPWAKAMKGAVLSCKMPP